MNMNNTGASSIDDKFLGSRDMFGVRFSQGLIFLEVEGWEQNRYSPYNEIGDVEGQSSAGFERLEHEGDDILYIEKSDKKMLHCAIGQSPSHIRRYTNYPEGENRLRSFPNLGTPRSGDDFGYVDGNDSPYEQPTDVEELWIPPGVHLDFNFYNADTQTHEPILNIVAREYNIRPLVPDRDEDARQIRRIVSPGSPMPLVPAGSMDRQVEFDLDDFWEVEPIGFDEARRLGGGN